MKKVFVILGILLSFGMFYACSSDDEVMGTERSSDFKTAEAENYDSTYQVNYYTEVPGLNVKQGYWSSIGFIELFPQSTPPYNLLVQWNDEQGKKAIDYILENNSDVMTKDAYNESNNEYRITSNRYFESPFFYVSTYYKSSEHPTLDCYNIVVLPQIMIKMNLTAVNTTDMIVQAEVTTKLAPFDRTPEPKAADGQMSMFTDFGTLDPKAIDCDVDEDDERDLFEDLDS